MKRIAQALLAGLVFTFLVAVPARAQQPAHLVKDINPGTDDEYGLSPRNFVAFNGAVYFGGYDDFHGSELWRSDGTAEGTGVFAEFEPGWYNRSFQLVPARDRLLIFVGADEVWASNGTAVGTRRVKKLTGLNNVWPAVSVGSTAFFTARLTPDYRFAIGRSDGTEAGTFLVHEFDEHAWMYPSEFVAGDNLLYFHAASGGRDALWRSDGTREGTFPILQTPFRAVQAATIGDTLLFNHCSTTPPWMCELWRTDGSAASTHRVAEVAGAYPSSPYGLARVGPYVYFQGYDDTGYGVWRSDGSAAGTIRLVSRTHIRSFAQKTPSFVAVGSLAVFAASREDGSAFWRTDGTAAGTWAVAATQPRLETVALFAGADTAYAIVSSYNDDFSEFHRALWAVDGTATGTHHVVAVDDGSWYGDAAVVGNQAYFASRTPDTGYELWTANAGGARIVVDVKPASSAWPWRLTAAGSTLFFMADAPPAPGTPSVTKLWTSDGTADGTAMVKPDLDYSRVYNLVPGGDRVYFIRTNTSYELWTSDGTDGGTIKLADETSGILSPHALASSTLFFARRGDVWKTDGTLAGTVLVKAMPPNRVFHAGWYPPLNFQAIDDSVYFRACTDEHGCEPWVTDGTDAGTRMIADLAPGDASSDAAEFTAANGQVFFLDSSYPRGLWKTDGTASGTTLVHRFEAGRNPYALQVLGTRLVLAVGSSDWSSDEPHELWATDGTPSGTSRIAGFPAGPYGNVNLWSFTRIGDVMLFSADDGVHGRELWRTDGTAAGTSMVIDLFPGEHNGAGEYYYSYLVVSGLRAVFTGVTPEHGSEVFVTDGTAEGTRLLTDINPGSDSSNAYELVIAGPNLYIAAGRTDVGYELWTVVLSPGSALDDLAQDLDALGLAGGVLQSLKAKLQAALNAIDRGHTSTAASLLEAFIKEVEAFSGKKIAEADAAALIDRARRIIESL